MIVITVARKPIEGSVAANALKYGCGALNIDAARIASDSLPQPTTAPGWDSLNARNAIGGYRASAYEQGPATYVPSMLGRWPANVVLSEDTVAALDDQSGTTHGVVRKPTGKAIYPTEGTSMTWNANNVVDTTTRGFADIGGASRFFKVVGQSDPE